MICARHRRPRCRWPSSATCSVCCPERATLLKGPTTQVCGSELGGRRGHPAGRHGRLAGYSAYAMDTIAARSIRARRRPVHDPGEPEVDGERMDDQEILMETLLILIGG